MHWKRYVAAPCCCVALAVGSFAVGCALHAGWRPANPSAAFAQPSKVSSSSAPATTKAMTIGGKEVGALLFNNKEILRLTATVGDLSPLQRVSTVATRINQAVASGVSPKSIHPSTNRGKPAVRAEDELLVTLDPGDAEGTGRTAEVLSQEWSVRISQAMSQHYARTGRRIDDPSAEWKPEEPYEDKWVPIVSLLEGVKIGAARIDGPRSKVKLVQAVAQLETHFKKYLEIDVYLPISTKVPGKKLDIVKGCAVTGLGDIDL